MNNHSRAALIYTSRARQTARNDRGVNVMSQRNRLHRRTSRPPLEGGVVNLLQKQNSLCSSDKPSDKPLTMFDWCVCVCAFVCVSNYLLPCLRTHLPTYLLTSLPTDLTDLLTHILADLLAHLLTYLPAVSSGSSSISMSSTLRSVATNSVFDMSAKVAFCIQGCFPFCVQLIPAS